SDCCSKGIERQVVHELSEDKSTLMHGATPAAGAPRIARSELKSMGGRTRLVSSLHHGFADALSNFPRTVLGQSEVTKGKGTPVWRPAGILPYGSACGLRGFSTAHPCTGEKHARIVRASLRAPAGHGHRGHADPAGPATGSPCPWRSPGRRVRRLYPAHP